MYVRIWAFNFAGPLRPVDVGGAMTKTCPECDGYGAIYRDKINEFQKETCLICDGSGEIEMTDNEIEFHKELMKHGEDSKL